MIELFRFEYEGKGSQNDQVQVLEVLIPLEAEEWG